MTRSVLPITIALAALLSSPHAHADDNKERARQLLVKGNELLDSGSYREALERFRQAYKAFPSPALLLNMGTALRGLHRYAEANNHYNRWLAATRRPKQRSEVEAAIAELDQMVGRLHIQATETEAEVAIDGVLIDPRLYGGVVRVEPGDHEIAAKKPGFRDYKTSIRVSAGERRTVRLILTREANIATTELETTNADADADSDDDEVDIDLEDKAPPPNTRDNIATTLKVGGLVAAGVGVISLAAGFKYGLDARRLSGDVDQLIASGADPSIVDQRTAEGQRANGRFIAFTAVGGAAIVAGGVMYVLGRSRKQTAKKRKDIAVTPMLSSTLAGLSLASRF